MTAGAGLPHLSKTKLHQPVGSRGLVSRPLLITRLDQILQRSLTVVSAPAGYGKTTILCSWLSARDVPGAWVTLEESDDDLITFVSYFIAALQTVFPDAGSDTQDLLNAGRLPPLTYLTDSLIDELWELPEPVCLILDDYHHIKQNDIHQLVATLTHLPVDNFHLVLSTRHDPPIPLARLRGSQQLYEVRANDLRFSEGEAELLLAQMLDDEISSDLVTKLVAQTEGWAVGLRMAGLTMRGQPDYAAFVDAFNGNHRFVTTYLIDEVFDHQPQAIRTFLLRTSILNQFCAPLCDAVMAAGTELNEAGKTDFSSQALLDGLERANLFVNGLDQHAEWFSYHPLFRDLLIHRLRLETPIDEITALHVAAARWLEEHGFVEVALRHYLTVQDIDGGIALFARHRYELLSSTQWLRLARWLKQFPAEHLDMDPELLMAQVWLDYHDGKATLISFTMGRLEAALKNASADPEKIRSYRGEMAVMRAAQAYDAVDPVKSIDYARQAIADVAPEAWGVRNFARLYMAVSLQMQGDLPGALAALDSGYEESAAQSEQFKTVHQSYFCHIYGMTGDLRRLSQSARLGFRLGRSMPEFMGWHHYFLGFVAYHQNDMPEALRHFTVVVDHPYLSNAGCYTWSACGLALAYLASGQVDEGEAVVERAAAFNQEIGNTQLLARAHGVQMELALRQGDVAPAIRWAESFAPDLRLVPCVQFYVLYSTLAKAWMAQGSEEALHKADHLLQRLQDFVERTHNTRYQIEVLAIRALFHRVQNDLPEACATLEHALRLAQPGGFVRIFVDLGSVMADLLWELRAAETQGNGFIDHVLAAFADTDKGPSTQPNLVDSTATLIEPLTDRELDVLHLLAKRLTDKEIAAQLVISRNTVSSHTRNIFAKLDTHSRRQAVARAVQLGIISRP